MSVVISAYFKNIICLCGILLFLSVSRWRFASFSSRYAAQKRTTFPGFLLISVSFNSRASLAISRDFVASSVGGHLLIAETGLRIISREIVEMADHSPHDAYSTRIYSSMVERIPPCKLLRCQLRFIRDELF